MQYQDYYKTLGVSKNASDDEIKKAYRKLARKYHPDVSDEANAEDKFKEVKEAYEVLKDPQKRQAYDTMGSNWQAGVSGFQGGAGTSGFADQFSGGDFSDFFEAMFGQGATGGFHHQDNKSHGKRQAPPHRKHRGRDQSSKVRISLEEAFSGTEISLSLRDSEQNQQTGQVEHKNRGLKVKVPAGVTTGQQIRLSGQGSKGLGGGPNGDLYLEIDIKPHHLYQLEGKNIFLNLPITPWEAALGATIEVPTLGGRVGLKIPANSQSGKKMRLKGRGLPGKSAGDQYVILQIYAPEAKTDEEKELYEKLAEQTKFNPRQEIFGG
ncbi:MAG: DnaJ domain-containing protein [Gammaproteobacteria bacterium]|nr:DnaJ domain-containing protein [Gammaproteobacteria bacterium]